MNVAGFAPAAFFLARGEFSWMQHAACRPRTNHPSARKQVADQYFAERPTTTGVAKRTCKRCPVREECLQSALETSAEGIWGGLDDKERAALKEPR